MQPLHIRWALNSPMVVPEFPIHLDALLARARVDEEASNGNPGDWSVQDDLPLERFESDLGWVWKASWLRLVPARSMSITPMVRRADEVAFAEDRAAGIWGSRRRPMSVLNQGSGQYKGYFFHVPEQWFSEAEAWCIGDIERVCELLSRLPSLGKLSRNGRGQIHSLEVAPASEAGGEAWRWRSMPGGLDLGAGWAPSTGALHPPYWKEKGLEIQEPFTLGPDYLLQEAGNVT